MMSMVCFRSARKLVLPLVLWAALRAPGRSESFAHEGKRIVSIGFSPPGQPVDPAELRELVLLAKDKALRAADIRDAITKLYATGRYEDIAVDVEPELDGVRVRFITRNKWFVGRVSVEGSVSDPPNRGQMVNATRLDLGQPFREEGIGEAQASLHKLLVDSGYYENQIQQLVEYDPKAQQAHIHFVVASGPRARYTTPIVKGNLKIAVETIITAARWKRRIIGGWKNVSQNRTRQGISNIRSRYEKEDRLMASVDLKSMDYDSKARRVTPSIEIEAGPKIEIKAVGAKVSAKKLKQNVPVYEERTVDRDLLMEGQRNLRDDFQAAGYFEADVEFDEQKPQGDQQEIVYLVNLGRRHRLVHLDVQGNHYFTTGSIRERLLMTPKSFQLRQGRYSEALLRRDEEAVVALYKGNGFRDVHVTSKVVDDYGGKTADLAVFLVIEEGPQWFVSKLEVTGIQQLDASGILPTLSSTDGQPFSEFNVASDRDTILAYYFSNGFPNASFEWSLRPGAIPHQVDLHFAVTEGRRELVRDVLVSGLDTTRPAVVERALLMAPGDPLSPIRMADTQRRLYDLGIFAKVDMAIQNPGGQEQRKYVIYDMEEAKRYSIAGGVGAEIARIGGCTTCLDVPGGATGFSPRINFDVTRLNFLGLGHTVSLQTRVSTLEQRALVTYVAPRVRDHDNLDLTFSALYDDTRDVNTFSAKREEGSAQLSQKLSKPSTLLYRLSYRRVSASNLKIDPNLVPLLSQSVRVGSASLSYIQDRRDDPTDAHKGIYNTVDVSIASHLLGSQINYFRFLAQNATYHRLGKQLVVARELTLGGLAPFHTNASDGDPLLAVPFSERFFSGGGTSHRGFPENQAGPRDLTTGFPLGGKTLLFNKTELRFPVIGANIGGVLFHDAGNVYSTFDKISLRFHQRDLQDFDYMVHAVGFGIRIRTPIGPIRGDLAYSINPPRFFGCKGSISDLVACGNDPSKRTNQSIGHIQFFFSIGQTF